MKRNTVAVVTTVSTMMLGAGWVAGVVGAAANAGPGGLSIDALGSGNGLAGSTLSPSPTAAGTTASPTPSAGASAAPGAVTTTTGPAATTPAATTPAPAAPPPPPAPSGTFDGASVRTAYGNYQVEITVEAGQITNISMLQSGNSDGTSRQISGNALPQLINAVLQSQTANVGYVSGASYTSQGFEASVNDAMVQAGLA